MLFRDPVQGTVEGLGFPPHWLPRDLALLPAFHEAPSPHPVSLHRAVWTPPHRNLMPLKLYRYSKGKGSAKTNFPRQSEQMILMRAWKWETNDTKLVSLPFVNCVGESTKPLSESAVVELKAASSFRKFLSQEPPTFFSQSCSSHLLRSLFKLLQGSQGPSLLAHNCFKFPLGRSTDHRRKRGSQSPWATQIKVKARTKVRTFPKLCP